MKRLFIAVLLIFMITTAFTQTINKAEYFFDADPGIGNGTPVTISNPGISVSFPVAIPVNLSPGFHWLAIRVRDSDGKWSLFSKRSFFVSQVTSDLPIITQAEYFYDNDPGVGSGNLLTIQTPGFSISQTFSIPVPLNMTAGTHHLAIRVKDQAGHWSLFQRDSIVVGGSTASIICPGNVVVTAASGQCSAIVNNIDPTVSPQGSSYTYTLTGATAGSGTGTASGKTFNVGVTTVTYALTDAPSTSCSFSVTVNSGTTASVNINTAATTICSGQRVSFAATPVNGGNTPSYQWKLNGNNITGAIYSAYQSSSLVNGDVVSAVMTSSISCASPSSATSNAITMTVHPIVTPSVSITASATSICPGQSVTFTATPVNGGTQPIFQWVKNGVLADAGVTYQASSLANGDSVYVILYNTTDCIPNTDIISNVIHITVGQNVTPSVTISAPSTTICLGQTVTFTATPENAGTNPTYQWQLNGNNIPGATNTSYQSTSLQNGDKIKVIMTVSSSCFLSSPISSNEITISVGSGVIPSVSIYASQTSICTGWLVKFFANPVNGGDAPIYQWKLNGNNVGTNSGIFQSTTLNDNDVVSVVMTSSLSCAGQQPVESNAVTITVGVPVMPSVSIEADNTTICPGTPVTFTAHPTNGGNTPQYLWMVNGNDVGVNSDTYQTSTLTNGDSIQVIMTSSLECAILSTAISNTITMTVTQPIIYYVDKDRDGYGDAGSSVLACGPQAGLVTNKSDCNDNDASIHPGATEICGNDIDDNCNGLIDENCSNTTLPVLMLRTYPVKEGDAGLTTLNTEVTLDKPASSPVSIHYATANEDAIAGLDYLAAAGELTIPAGSSSGTIQVKIIGDLLKESNERFTINFSNPVNVVLPADSQSKIMIIDDDKGKGNNTIAGKETTTIENDALRIPTLARRNQVWMIPQIGRYENEVLIMNAQGLLVSRFVNYQNNTAISNVASGLYFYRIRILDSGQFKYYSGRLLITE